VSSSSILQIDPIFIMHFVDSLQLHQAVHK
jgi:hypothetical protein